MTERRMIEVNHALSGVHGVDVKQSAQRLTESRRQIFKRLQRKKKLASVIQDELYGFLEKNPEEKEGLHQQAVKKKKNKNQNNQEETHAAKMTYKSPVYHSVTKQYLNKDCSTEAEVQKKFSKWFQFPMDTETEEGITDEVQHLNISTALSAETEQKQNKMIAEE